MSPCRAGGCGCLPPPPSVPPHPGGIPDTLPVLGSPVTPFILLTVALVLSIRRPAPTTPRKRPRAARCPLPVVVLGDTATPVTVARVGAPSPRWKHVPCEGGFRAILV